MKDNSAAWMLNVVYLLILHDTKYRTCELTQKCSLWWEGCTLIQFKGSRVLSRCCVLVCKPCMLVVRHTLRIRVIEITRLLQYSYEKLICLYSHIRWPQHTDLQKYQKRLHLQKMLQIQAWTIENVFIACAAFLIVSIYYVFGSFYSKINFFYFITCLICRQKFKVLHNS